MKGPSRHAVLCGAVFLAVSLPAALPVFGAAAAFAQRAVDLSAEQDRAVVEFEAFLRSPDHLKDSGRWGTFEDRFRKIHERDRGGARADEALYMVGEVNYERHRLFRKRGYLDAAVAAYTRLLDMYRFSSRASDALVRLGDIHYYNLNDPRRAYLLYRRAERGYPETEAARRAAVRVVAIEGRHPEFASQDETPLEGIVSPSGSGKPLPSPGAVLGGRGRGGATRAPVAVSPGGSGGAAEAGREALPGRALGEAGARATRKSDEAPAFRPHRGEPPAHPVLQEGREPLKRPSDDLPTLRSLRR